MVGMAIASLSLAAGLWLHGRHNAEAVPTYTCQLNPENMSQWSRFGGSWQIVDEAIQSNSYERGAKLLTGSKGWANYTVSSDIWFEGPAADMGVVIRTNEEGEGVDAYRGYFVGLRSLDGTLVLGRANYTWLEVPPVTLPGGIHPFRWYRLRVTAYGCHVGASVTDLLTKQAAWIAFQEHFCISSGRFGLRSLNANAKWSNIRVQPATWNDYLLIEQHAASVEHPVVVNGPPWWTPWHVMMLFIGALTTALLTQLAYFRLRTWKTSTINRERERLAHEIHDTMAQGFAGIGYQIQGIRTSVLRAETLDARGVAEQLNVAYQLVRSCHEEASRTIAILGLASPAIQDHLLEELASIARKTAQNKIQTLAELTGNPVQLNLRVADALLHIGREAISNALSHGNPTVLKIKLTYAEGTVELVVEDNGCGFEYTQEKEGFGILGMQKRARGLGSELCICSSSGKGTQVGIKAVLKSIRLRDRIAVAFKRRIRWSFLEG